jgi:transcriptional regulator with XRE-family HTH domain
MGFLSTSGMLEPDRQDNERRSLAGALRELRRAAGLSGERLAVRCAMSQAKISRIETGKVLPTVIDVERILTALSVPTEVASDLLSMARYSQHGVHVVASLCPRGAVASAVGDQESWRLGAVEPAFPAGNSQWAVANAGVCTISFRDHAERRAQARH